MIKLKQIIKYDNANALEATWVDVTTEEYQSPIMETNNEGVEVDTGKTETKTREIETVIKCHAYDGTQMDMLRADALELGTSLEEYQELIAEVEAAYTPPTQEELDAIAEEQTNIAAKEQRAAAMLEGDIYPLAGVDYRVSFTKDDGDGLMQVKSAFELGLASTIIYFANGAKMPITAEEFEAFAVWFVNKRNEFFV